MAKLTSPFKKPRRFAATLDNIHEKLDAGILVLNESTTPPVLRINDHLSYQVRTVAHQQPVIKEVRQAYFELRNNWDDDQIIRRRSYKALVLNSKDKLICEVSFIWQRTLRRQDLKSMMLVISAYNGAKVILARNHTYRNILPSENEKLQYNQFKRFGKELNMEVKDQLIMSSAECFFFSVNGL